MEPIHVLFLDFDGVLTSDEFDATYVRQTYVADPGSLDPKCVAQLQRALDSIPSLKIVVTSTWRLKHNLSTLRQILSDKGLKTPDRVIDITPYFPNDLRAKEIKAWLAQHPEVKGFVVIDDEAGPVASLSTHLVHPDSKVGMKHQDVQEIIMKIYQP